MFPHPVASFLTCSEDPSSMLGTKQQISQTLELFSKLSYGPLDRFKMIPQGVGTFSTIGQPILRTFIFWSFFDPNRPLPHLTLSPPWPRASGRKMCQIHCVLLCLSSRPSVSRNVWRGRCHRLPSLRTTLSQRQPRSQAREPFTGP